MLKISLIMSIMGIIILFSIFFIQKPIILNNSVQLNNIKENSLISISGTISKEVLLNEYKVITIDGIKIATKRNTPSLLNKKVNIIAKKDDYWGLILLKYSSIE